MSTDESERRVAEALRARATGAGRPGAVPMSAGSDGMSVRAALLTALLAGAVLGMLLALLSLLVPGLLPALG
ncbi:MAG: hypothetical protein QOG20_2364 [Pseudonocardiales bacterium]|jgi:hypothetical protein|uniref:hypothetical protein n=1 Tax=Pseudonocardia sp. TaxID=60912 RepID=UPI0026394725|nr:hypothetical protein [Pseudonocardia sp.]MCW2721619.1 hypothetical protein [Pseudonocardia sp.]MDT7613190.1 hypothetical protein [Pseudonocardiales bacterium]MDT7706757.1 hypothetical protein [Pseudonocardiales bacterium]